MSLRVLRRRGAGVHSCTVPQIRGYQNRIGGPLIDRIDLHLDVRRIRPAEILEREAGTSSRAAAGGGDGGPGLRLVARIADGPKASPMAP
ncbi:MAG: ATP-binding protein [Adlercreutzia equolifaciens]